MADLARHPQRACGDYTTPSTNLPNEKTLELKKSAMDEPAPTFFNPDNPAVVVAATRFM
jgi:hypothetical protein